MKLATTIFALVVALIFTTSLTAEAPAQTGPAKVGVVNSEMFSAANGGITRLVNALKTLETEFKPRRDEITQMVNRLNSLQQVPPNTPAAELATRRDQAETLQVEIQRKQEDARGPHTQNVSRR